MRFDRLFVCCRCEDCVVELFLKGAVLGFLIAAPVGPIGLLCITRTLRAGWRSGFFSGLGAATADAAYAAIAACGLAAVTRAFTAVSAPLHLGASMVLVALGVMTLRTKKPAERAHSLAPSVLAAYASTVVLTLLNPLTILSFVAFFGTAIGARSIPIASAFVLVAGAFAGSTAWWLILASAVSLVRYAVDGRTLERINLVCGCGLIAFALYALVR